MVAVLDMGASATRLVVIEIAPDRTVRTLEEASRGIQLGRDTFSSGVIRSSTIDAVISALDGFRHVMEEYAVTRVRAVATSAVREARNVDVFLDRVHRRTGIEFEIINEAEEARLLYLAVKHTLSRHAALHRAWTLLTEVGGGSTSVTLLRQGQPHRSAVYALGAVRLRQALHLQRLTHDVQLAILKRSITNVIQEIRLDIPMRRVSQLIALGGDVRFAAAQILDDAECGRRAARSAPGQVPGVLLGDRASGRGPADRAVPAPSHAGRDAPAVAARLSDPARRNGRSLAHRLGRDASHGRVARSGRDRQPDRSRSSRGRCSPAPKRSARSTASTARTAVMSRCWPAGCSTCSRASTASPAATACCCSWRRCSTTSGSTSASGSITSTRSICSRRRRSSA